jgi:hypothetical protein
MGDQGTDTNNRVVDVLGELVADCSANFLVALAGMPLAAAKRFRSGTVSISQTMTLLVAHI